MDTYNKDLELDTEPGKKLANIAYLLQMAGLLIGVPFFIGVIFNYLKINQVRGTWVESHFNWQIKTFWYGLVILILGLLTLANVVGGILLVFDALWVSYRIFYGWSKLNKEEQVIKLP